MASSAVLGCVLAALLEDYDIYDELTLATLIVDGDVAADIARRLRHDDFAAKLCAAKAIARGIEYLSCTARMRMPMLVWRLRAARRATRAAWQHT